MTPEYYFEKAKRALHLDATTPLDDAYALGATPTEANELAQLVLKGTKTATSSAYDLYEPSDEMPFVGEYDVIVDAMGDPVCVTMTDSVRVVPYSEVDADHARREGEGDRSLDYWQQVHSKFFTTEFAQAGRQFDPAKAQLVLETFHVVYPVAKQD